MSRPRTGPGDRCTCGCSESAHAHDERDPATRLRCTVCACEEFDWNGEVPVVRTAKQRAHDRRMLALYFLQEVHGRAQKIAEGLDPKRKRDYAKDPVLQAVDGIAEKAAACLDGQGLRNWRDGEALS